MPHRRNECDPWIWTPQMDDWFTRHFLDEEEEERAEQMLARLLPDLPADIHLAEGVVPLISADLLV